MGRMPKAATAPPAFCKVMMDDFLNKVCLPRAFIKNFNGDIPKKVTLTSPDGRSCSASVKNIGKDWFLCKKWSTFAKQHALQYGEFLVFRLNGHAAFSVTIYKKNACEKVIPSAEKGIVESNFCLGETEQGKEVMKVSKHHPQILHEIMKNKSDPKGKMNGTPLRPIRSDVPKIARCSITLGLAAKYQVALPRKFAREIGFTKRESIILVDQFGMSWPVNTCQSKSGSTILSSGWSQFRNTQNLHTADTCEFVYEEGMGNAIRVNTVPAIESKETSE